jgi:prepilin-type N-terminal cleavage/methylation domain-containing protein
MKRCEGFTLVEVLVASLLMGMLVTILTMVFNQSSIAWRTGKASVAEMDEMRRYYSQVQRHADDALPGVLGTTAGRIGGAWDGDGALQRRALAKWDTAVGINSSSFTPPSSDKSCFRCPGRDFKTGTIASYTVGVWSYGPDGQPDTGDDISTWPVDVE